MFRFNMLSCAAHGRCAILQPTSLPEIRSVHKRANKYQVILCGCVEYITNSYKLIEILWAILVYCSLRQHVGDFSDELLTVIHPKHKDFTE